MKKCLIFLTILLLLTACSKNVSQKSLIELSDNYSLDDAKADECVVYENGDITSGQSVWDHFIETTSDGKTSTVRLCFYYTLGEPSKYSKEYYEEIKDDYPVLYTEDLSFDGSKYRIEYVGDDGQLISKEYSYLMKYTGKPKSPSALFSEYTYYVLVNDNTVTWNDIERGMLSSKFGDYIEHDRVYSDYTWK